MTQLKKDQIYHRLRTAILSGQYAPGFRLPSEPDFCIELGVSRVTLRSALQRLSVEGLISRQSRHGTIVAQQPTLKQNKVLFVDGERAEVDEYYPVLYILPSLDQACRERQLTLDKIDLRSFPAAEISSLAERIGQEYLGIVSVASGFHGQEVLLELFRASNLPVVIAHGLETDHQITGMSVVATDERAAFADGLRHLASFGHRQVATIWLQETLRRGFEQDEYACLLDSLGMDSDPRLCVSLPRFDEEAGITVVRDFLEKHPCRPTALMCYSDHVAMLCYPALRQLGLRVPDDMAVMGYCGLPGGALLVPPLSTVDVGYARIGVMAVELMLQADQWHRPEIKPPLVFSPYVVKSRQSTEKILWQEKLSSKLGTFAPC